MMRELRSVHTRYVFKLCLAGAAANGSSDAVVKTTNVNSSCCCFEERIITQKSTETELRTCTTNLNIIFPGHFLPFD